jgi:hypothetical protein
VFVVDGYSGPELFLLQSPFVVADPCRIVALRAVAEIADEACGASRRVIAVVDGAPRWIVWRRERLEALMRPVRQKVKKLLQAGTESGQEVFGLVLNLHSWGLWASLVMVLAASRENKNRAIKASDSMSYSTALLEVYQLRAINYLNTENPT